MVCVWAPLIGSTKFSEWFTLNTSYPDRSRFVYDLNMSQWIIEPRRILDLIIPSSVSSVRSSNAEEKYPRLPLDSSEDPSFAQRTTRVILSLAKFRLVDFDDYSLTPDSVIVLQQSHFAHIPAISSPVCRRGFRLNARFYPKTSRWQPLAQKYTKSIACWKLRFECSNQVPFFRALVDLHLPHLNRHPCPSRSPSLTLDATQHLEQIHVVRNSPTSWR